MALLYEAHKEYIRNVLLSSSFQLQSIYYEILTVNALGSD